MTDIVEKAHVLATMLEMGERIAFGSDAAMIEGLAEEVVRLRKERSELLEALERLFCAQLQDDSGMDYADWSDAMKADRDEWYAARDAARTIIAKARTA